MEGSTPQRDRLWVSNQTQMKPQLTNLLPLSFSCLFVVFPGFSLCMLLPVLFTLPASAWRWGMSLKGYGSTLCHQPSSLLILRVWLQGVDDNMLLLPF